jgi:hypothetical protein
MPHLLAAEEGGGREIRDQFETGMFGPIDVTKCVPSGKRREASRAGSGKSSAALPDAGQH